MDIPKDYLQQLKRRGKMRFRSERQELIQDFVDKINAERTGTKFKPVTARQINTLLALLSVRDLYWLRAACGRAPSFSKKFFGVLHDMKVGKTRPFAARP